MSTAEWMQKHRKKIPVMVNGKTFTITGNELFKVNEILFKMNTEDVESVFKVNNALFKVNIELCKMNIETCENSSKTPFFAENSAISAPKGGRGGFSFINNSTSNPNSTVTSTISTKEKNKRKKEKICEFHIEEISKNLEIFWQAWPRSERKANREGTKRSLLRALRDNKGLTFEKIMAALEWWKKKWRDPQYIPAPIAWLNGRRWEAMDNAPPEPSEPTGMAYIAPPIEEKRDTISRAEFVAILKGGSSGPATAIQ